MRMTGGMVVLLGLVWVTGSTAADGEYSLVLKEYKAGSTVSIQRKGNATMFARFKDVEGLNGDDKELKMNYTFVFWEQVLGKSGSGVNRLRRGYGEARKTEPDKDIILPYEGKIVDIDKVDGQFVFRLDKKPLVGKDADDLDKEFNKTTENRVAGAWNMLARERVKLNETWNLDGGSLVREMQDLGVDFGGGKIQAVARLEKVYDANGRRFGAVLVHIEAPIRALRQESVAMPLEKGAKLVVQLTYDGCIDGSSHDATIKSIIQLNGTAIINPIPTKTFKVPIVVRGVDNQTIKDQSK